MSGTTITIPSLVSTNMTTSSLINTSGINASFNSNTIGSVSSSTNINLAYTLRIDGTTNEDNRAITCDATGNMYVAGNSTSTTASFYATDGTTIVATMANPNPNRVGYIAKYNTQGALQYTLRIDGTNSEYNAAITCDATGNVYVAGYSNSTTASFYATDGTTIVTTMANPTAIQRVGYIVKYDSQGALQYTLRIDGNNSEDNAAITCDATGNVYVAGYSQSTTASFYATDGTTVVATMANVNTTQVGYIVKYNSQGALQYTLRIDGNSSEFNQAITCDATGNVYVAGSSFSTTASFYATDGTTVVQTIANVGTTQVGYIVKYNSQGALQYTLRIDGNSSEFNQAITCDATGNVYVAGYSNSTTASFYATDGTTIVATMANTNINYVGYVAKYDSQGALQYTLRIDGNSSEFNQAITCDATGNVYVGGYSTSTTVSFYATDGTTIVATMANMNTNWVGYIAKYNTQGALQYTLRTDGTNNEINRAITCDATGNVYVAGQSTSTTASFYATDGTTVVQTMANVNANNMGYIAKYTQPIIELPTIITTAGNIGINTTAPSSTLQVNGSLAKSSGTFDIQHPLYDDRRLIHSFIEGPRCDLIYRGQVTLVNGTAVVNIDTDCVAEEDCAMTEGTFTSLAANSDVFLTNKTGFSELTYTLSGNTLTITSEENTNDTVSWMVVAERADATIKQWNRTNQNGFLITEY
jgi:pentose-5-phosphate-3-epimerase